MRMGGCAALIFGLMTLPANGTSPTPHQKLAYFEVPKPGGVDRLCFLYDPRAGRSMIGAHITAQMDPEYPNGQPYYYTYNYAVSPDESTVTVSGLFSLKQPRPNGITITAKLYDTQQPGWPCTGRNWATQGLETVVSGTTPNQNPQQSTRVAEPIQKVLYYAFSRIDNFDAFNNPILDATTARQSKTPVCLLWRSDWEADNTIGVPSAGFYKSFSFRVDKSKQQIDIYELAAPALEQKDGKLVPITTSASPVRGQEAGDVGVHVYKSNVVVPLFTQPQSGWPCTKAYWDSLMAAREEWEEEQKHRGPAPPPGWGMGGGPASHGPNVNWCAGIKMGSAYCAPLRR